MPRKLKYGLETKMKRVPIKLDEVINSICLKYGSLNEIERIKFIENLNEETRKDSEEKICPHCHKYKKLQGSGIIHQLCECGD